MAIWPTIGCGADGLRCGRRGGPSYDIAVLKGDGVGPDVVDEAVRLREATVDTGGTHLKFSETPLQGL